MHSKTRFKTLIASVALAASGLAAAQTATLLNVSYDVAREFYKDYNPAFVAHYKKTTGKDVKIDQAHGGSSAQARAVNDGLDADVVTFNTTTDIDFLAQNGVVAKDWTKKFPYDASPTTSTMLFLVRKGNPRTSRTGTTSSSRACRWWWSIPRPAATAATPIWAPGARCAKRAAPMRRPPSSWASSTRTCRCWARAGAMRPASSCSAIPATC